MEGLFADLPDERTLMRLSAPVTPPISRLPPTPPSALHFLQGPCAYISWLEAGARRRASREADGFVVLRCTWEGRRRDHTRSLGPLRALPAHAHIRSCTIVVGAAPRLVRFLSFGGRLRTW